MKKRLLIVFTLALAGLILFTLSKRYDHPVAPSAVTEESKKLGLTPAEMIEEDYARKKKRRENGYSKADKPSEYAKYHLAIRTPDDLETPAYAFGQKLDELEKAKSNAAASRSIRSRTNNVTWTERGPGNVPGRTRGLAVDPADPDKNTWYAGSVAGGVWKTTTAGQSWTLITPNLPNLATTCIAMAESNPNIIYVGTGESFAGYNGVNGDGIFKSTDRGNTWTQLASTTKNARFNNINRIIVSPTDPNLVLAVSSLSYWGGTGPASSIMRSTNGGMTWASQYSSNRDIEHIVADPENFDIQYAAVNAIGVIKSIDGGITWNPTGPGIEASGRIEIAIAPSKISTVYASAVGTLSGKASDLYVSINSGESWSLVDVKKDNVSIDFLGGQGFYDNTIAVNPYNDKEVYLGGVDMFRVTTTTTAATTADILGVNEDGTQSFLSFINFGQPYFNGALSKGTSTTGFANVEVRFGPGLKQLAYRFTVPATGGTNADGGAGIPDADYVYQDYVEVPFQVWDVDNNKQLMVAFRDQQRNEVFNLNDRLKSGEQLLDNREYLYISAVEYSITPDANMAKKAGHTYKNLYFFWPTLTANAVWDPANLPNSKMAILYGSRFKTSGVTAIVADAYNRFSGPNRFNQVTGETQISGVHPDHHNLLVIPVDEAAKTFKILNANDGGVYVSNSSTTPGISNGDWTFAGSGYNTTQFYGADKKPGANEYIGGAQDNGTWRSPASAEASATSKYLRQLGGDGFEVVWNAADGNKIVGSSQYNGFARTTNGGANWISAVSGLTDTGSEKGVFISRLGNSKSNPDVLFAVGSTGVWTSENFGESWTSTPITSNWGFSSFLDVEVSLSNAQIVWAGSGMSNSETTPRKVHVSTDGGLTFNTTVNYAKASLGVLTGIATHPLEDSTAYVLFSFAGRPKVLKTTNLGQSWTDLSGFEGRTASSNGFPDVAVYTLLVHPHDPNTIWIGSEIGLIESTNGGQSWALASGGIPRVSIWDMKVVDDQIVLATHARGIWTATIPELPALIFSPEIKGIGFSPEGVFTCSARLKSNYDSTKVFANGNAIVVIRSTAVADTLLKATSLEEGSNSIQVISYVNGRAYYSRLKSIQGIAVEPSVLSYSNIFNSLANDDFSGTDFSIRKVTGFDNGAIHSPHSYLAKKEIIFQLKKPIVIAQSNALFQYDDVAIVEPGEPNTVYGGADFYDYVVVEGSTDGVNWKPIEPGYDARFKSNWLAVYNDKKAGAKSLFTFHSIDLLQTFSPGDIVFFRFRLFSDDNEVGWGWVIDNLYIQETKPLGFDEDILSNKFSMQTYPNPMLNNETTIEFYLTKSSPVDLKIYNSAGGIVFYNSLMNRPKGLQTFKINGLLLNPGVYFINLKSKDGVITRKLVVN